MKLFDLSNTGLTNNISDGCVTFRGVSLRALLLHAGSLIQINIDELQISASPAMTSLNVQYYSIDHKCQFRH